MSECELIAFISTVACTLAKCCSTDELTILSVVFTQLGDTLATVLAKRELGENNSDTDKKDDNNNCDKESDNATLAFP
jgi:hypothetical protein